MPEVDLPQPGVHPADVAVPAPSSGPGNWVGASSAVALDEGGFVIAYRVRTPLDRGGRVVVAHSADGVALVPVAEVTKDRMGAESLERPALVRGIDGRWRLYLSCATAGTKHWRIDLLEADTPQELSGAEPVTVLPGDGLTGVKDPVLRRCADGWEAWGAAPARRARCGGPDGQPPRSERGRREVAVDARHSARAASVRGTRAAPA